MSKNAPPKVANHVVKKFLAYREGREDWGMFEDVIVGGKLDEEAAAACLEAAREQQDEPAEVLASLLVNMAIDQRKFLVTALNPRQPHWSELPTTMSEELQAELAVRLKVPMTRDRLLNAMIMQSRSLDRDYKVSEAEQIAQCHRDMQMQMMGVMQEAGVGMPRIARPDGIVGGG